MTDCIDCIEKPDDFVEAGGKGSARSGMAVGLQKAALLLGGDRISDKSTLP